jgi:hypothetical protein
MQRRHTHLANFGMISFVGSGSSCVGCFLQPAPHTSSINLRTAKDMKDAKLVIAFLLPLLSRRATAAAAARSSVFYEMY